MLKNYSLRSFYDKELSLAFVLLAFTAANAKSHDIYVKVLCTT